MTKPSQDGLPSDPRPYSAGDPNYPNPEEMALCLENCEEDLLTEARYIRWLGREVERLRAACKKQPSQSPQGLPELPKAHGLNQQRGDPIRYHGADMLAYGAQCRAVALEQAAQIVEREAFPSEAARFGFAADAIRALAAAPKGDKCS